MRALKITGMMSVATRTAAVHWLNIHTRLNVTTRVHRNAAERPRVDCKDGCMRLCSDESLPPRVHDTELSDSRGNRSSCEPVLCRRRVVAVRGTFCARSKLTVPDRSKWARPKPDFCRRAVSGLVDLQREEGLGCM